MKLLNLKSSVIVEAPAWDVKRSKLGETKFNKTSLQDDHVQKVIAVIANARNVPHEEVQQLIQKVLTKISKLPSSQLLYDTIHQNNAEEFTFYELCDTDNISVNGPKFNINVFYKLLAKIKSEVSFMYRPISFMDRKPLLREDIQFLNNPLNFTGKKQEPPKSSLASIRTAAATPTGSFYFNVPFMQRLLDYAHIIDLKPSGKKYANNGGPFPVGYAYIEFLILHEYMHFTQSDFFVDKQIANLDEMAMNWAGDYRSNYILVKNGYTQLPMGLYSDHLNLDRQKSLKDLYYLVVEEIEKLKKLSPKYSVGQQVTLADGRKGIIKEIDVGESGEYIYDIDLIEEPEKTDGEAQ